MGNEVKLTFAGDADDLIKASQRANRGVESVGAAAGEAASDFDKAAAQSSAFTDRVGKLGAAVDGASTAIGDAAGGLQALADAQSFSERAAADHARALNDLAQAQEDANQAAIDGRQAQLDVAQADIDAKQATLDAATAQEEYNRAVKEHGKGSAEAQQAALDLQQATLDHSQALADQEQALADARQATIDLEAAQLDANEATRAANPPELQKWADQLAVIAPLLQAVVGVVALVTAAQWAWNVAMTANPIGLIIVGIGLLVAGIVLIATKTTWFQTAWKYSWSAIKSAASSFWDWFKRIPGWTSDAFSKIASVISWPYRQAFNLISDAWNATIGGLSFSIPDWVPGLGGSGWSVPNLPRFHSGGVVPGPAGSEMLAVLQAGETVLPTQGGAAGVTIVLGSDGTAFGDALVEVLAGAMRDRGGDPGALGIRIARAA